MIFISLQSEIFMQTWPMKNVINNEEKKLAKEFKIGYRWLAFTLLGFNTRILLFFLRTRISHTLSVKTKQNLALGFILVEIKFTFPVKINNKKNKK